MRHDRDAGLLRGLRGHRSNSGIGFGFRNTGENVGDGSGCGPIFRWLVGPQSGALCPVAYEGTKLVGSLFSVPHSLRVGSSVHDNWVGLRAHRRPGSSAICVASHRTASSAQRRARNCIYARHGAQRSDIALQSVLDKIRTSVSPEPDLSVPGQLLGQGTGAGGTRAGGHQALGTNGHAKRWAR